VIAEFGRLDLLVNNASVWLSAPFLEISQICVAIRRWMSTFTGPFLCSQAAAPQMLAQEEGLIINITDLSAFQTWKNYAHHAASKAGLVALTKVMAAELAPHVRVNGIAPGTVMLPPNASPQKIAWAESNSLLDGWEPQKMLPAPSSSSRKWISLPAPFISWMADGRWFDRDPATAAATPASFATGLNESTKAAPTAFLQQTETPGLPTSAADSPPTQTPAPAAAEETERIPSARASAASPAPIGTTVIFPGGLELTILDVIYPADEFLLEEVGGDDLRRRVVAESDAGRAALVVEWEAYCPPRTDRPPLTTVCGALLSVTAVEPEQPLVDLAAYTGFDPRFPEIIGLPYGVPNGETRRSFIVTTSIPAGEAPELMEVVYYLSDAASIEYTTVYFDLQEAP
jgi:NAD(P)-dependent dehydrogenase (short-subunit alcohol dehydrogenase family)